MNATWNAFVLATLVWVVPGAIKAATWNEDFSADPSANGWQIFGDASLFSWDATNRNLRVTWDSSRTNTYYHLPLGNILTRDDDFQLSFDLMFEDYAGGVAPAKPYAFPAAIGLFNLEQATHTNFSRGTGVNATYGPRNLIEFDFFPAFDTFLPTVAQVIVSTNNSWLYNHENLLDLTPGQTFRVVMNYTAATRTLTTTVTNQAAPYGQPQQIVINATDFDFRVTSFSVSSYSHARSLDSILAHGRVDNVRMVAPPPPVTRLTGHLTNGIWQASFISRSNWLYSLERSTNLAQWTDVSATTPDTDGKLELHDTNPPAGAACYRVRAERP